LGGENDVDQDQAIIESVARHYGHLICKALNEMNTDEIRQLVSEMEKVGDDQPTNRSPLLRQAAEVLRHARRLPVGPDRNDLRQIAIGLIWLAKRGSTSKALLRVQPTTTKK
jgi:hypothetical protein